MVKNDSLPSFDSHNTPLFQVVFNRSTDAMLIANGEGSFIAANPSACQLLDYSQEKLKQMTILDVIPTLFSEWPKHFVPTVQPTSSDDEVGDVFAALKKGGSLEFETNYRRSNGSEFSAVGTIEHLINKDRDFFLVILQDVSERPIAQTNAGLQASEAHFRNILENIQLVAIILDRAGNLIFCNDYFLKLTGWNREEVLGQDWFALFIPHEIREEIYDIFQNTVTTSQFPAYHENVLITKENVKELIAWNNTTNVDSHGNVISVTSIGQNITEQKQSTEELAQRAVQLALINELGHQIAAILDQDELLQQTVQQVHRLFNYHHVAIFLVENNVLQLHAVAGMYEEKFPIGHTQSLQKGINGWVATNGKMVVANDVIQEEKFTSLIPDHNITKAELCLPIILRDMVIGVLDIQSPILNAFGENDIQVMETLTSQIAVAVGNARLFEQAELEITARREAEEELRKLSHAVVQSPASVVITDIRGNIEYVNAKFEEVTGYTAVEAIGQNPRILKSDYHDASFYDDFWRTISSGEVWRGEFRNKKKNGQLYWEMVSVSPVKDENGVIINFVGVKEDISEQKNLEKQVQQQDRLAAVGHLAAGIAHDFNNILAVISLYSQLLQRDKTLQGHVQSKLTTIVEQTDRASDLIGQILDFSRKSILERQSLNFLSQTKEFVKLLQRTLPESIDISFSNGAGSFMINADPTRMQQMMMNLCLNARDAMPDGGLLNITLNRFVLGEADSPPVPEMLPGEWLHMVISDTGRGIPDDILPHIYEPFFTTNEAGSGTGLGLAQVYGIIMQHDGFIGVESHVGIGSDFHIYLPPLPNFDSEADLGGQAELPLGNGELILVVEDDLVARQALQETLERLQYEVVAVENGRFALNTLAQHNNNIQIIISDVVMPDMGGLELLKILKSKKIQIPVIVLTGYIFDADLEDFKAEGMFGWITKPPSLEALTLTIRDALASRE